MAKFLFKFQKELTDELSSPHTVHRGETVETGVVGVQFCMELSVFHKVNDIVQSNDPRFGSYNCVPDGSGKIGSAD